MVPIGGKSRLEIVYMDLDSRFQPLYASRHMTDLTLFVFSGYRLYGNVHVAPAPQTGDLPVSLTWIFQTHRKQRF
jgi:hypothetical protein